jgi:DNA-binding transcriptional regulator/RsmH inhibitor MraZ
VDETSSQVSIVAEPPLGIFTAKCDDKGRLKLPVEFVTYLKALDVDKVFITTVDLKLARIYPKQTWESNQNLFSSAGDDAETAQDVAFIANLYGAYSEIDTNGRILVPTELRRKLEIEGQTVWLDYYNGRINAFGKQVYDERMQRALVNLGEKVKTLEKKGFK